MTQTKEGMVKFNRFCKALNFRKWSFLHVFTRFFSADLHSLIIFRRTYSISSLSIVFFLFFARRQNWEGREERTRRVHFRCSYLCVECPVFKYLNGFRMLRKSPFSDDIPSPFSLFISKTYLCSLNILILSSFNHFPVIMLKHYLLQMERT